MTIDAENNVQTTLRNERLAEAGETEFRNERLAEVGRNELRKGILGLGLGLSCAVGRRRSQGHACQAAIKVELM